MSFNLQVNSDFQSDKLDKLPRGVAGEGAATAKAKEHVEFSTLAESFPWNDFGMGAYATGNKSNDDNEQSVPEVDPGKKLDFQGRFCVFLSVFFLHFS